MANPLLEQAVAYIKAGNKEKGKQLLIDVLKQDPRDENAWLWMSRCVTTAEQKRDYFERVLKINPQNQHAIEGLKRLNNPTLHAPQPKLDVNQKQPVKKKGLSTIAAIVISGLALGLIGCFVLILLFANRPTSSATNIPLSTPTTIPAIFVDRYGTPPNHTVGDYWDNGKGTNFAYFLVADKSITLQETETLITYYKQKHPGFKLINIYIFCDGFYADVKYWDAMDYSGGVGDEVFKHVMYWYQGGEWSSSGQIFMTEPKVDYPTFGEACK